LRRRCAPPRCNRAPARGVGASSFLLSLRSRPTPGPEENFLAMQLLQGHDATCPHCSETINLTLDLSVPEQSYIEDCPVCCKPMLVSYSSTDGEVDALSVDASD
jgi:hypothetical protein